MSKNNIFFTRTILNEYIKATNYILHGYNQKKVVECQHIKVKELIIRTFSFQKKYTQGSRLKNCRGNIERLIAFSSCHCQNHSNVSYFDY